MQIGDQAFITMVIADETNKVLFASSDTNMVGAPGIKLMIENNPGDLMFVPMADGSVEVVNVSEVGNRIPTCAMSTIDFLNRGRDKPSQDDFVTIQSGENGIVVSDYENKKAVDTKADTIIREEPAAEKSEEAVAKDEDVAVEAEEESKHETEVVGEAEEETAETEAKKKQ